MDEKEPTPKRLSGTPRAHSPRAKEVFTRLKNKLGSKCKPWSEELIANTERELNEKAFLEFSQKDVEVILPDTFGPISREKFDFQFPPDLRLFLLMCGAPDNILPSFESKEFPLSSSTSSALPFPLIRGVGGYGMSPTTLQKSLLESFHSLSDTLCEDVLIWNTAFSQGLLYIVAGLHIVCNGPRCGELWEVCCINDSVFPSNPLDFVSYVERLI